jgi:hypothetical protein
MSAELLVAGLWAAVLVYWLWTRRPTTSDTVGLFRHELRVLRHATPMKVAPANRMEVCYASAEELPARPRPVPGPLAPTPLAAAAASYKRAEMRRRRRDILTVLSATAVVTLGGAVLSRSTFVIALQVLCDLALAAYVWLLVQSGRSRAPLAPRTAYMAAAAQGPRPAPARQAAPSAVPGPATVPGPAWVAPPVVATRPARRPAYAFAGAPEAFAAAPGYQGTREHGAGDYTAVFDQAYGDFESYASLALAQAN